MNPQLKEWILDKAAEVGDPRFDQKVARALDAIESGLVLQDMTTADGALWAVQVRSARGSGYYVTSDTQDVAAVDGDGELVNEGGTPVKCTCPAGRSGTYCYHRVIAMIRRRRLALMEKDLSYA